MAKVRDLSVSVSDYFSFLRNDVSCFEFFGIFACNSVKNATECKPQDVSSKFITILFFMKKIILTAFCFFSLAFCFSQTEKFTYSNGNEKIVFEILTGKEYLVENTLTRTKFILENIDPKKVNISGRTIRYMHEAWLKENEIAILMSPKEQDLENGNLKVRLSYKSGGEFKSFELEIPVKKE